MDRQFLFEEIYIYILWKKNDNKTLYRCLDVDPSQFHGRQLNSYKASSQEAPQNSIFWILMILKVVKGKLFKR